MKMCHISSFQKLGLLTCATFFTALLADEVPRGGILGSSDLSDSRKEGISHMELHFDVGLLLPGGTLRKSISMQGCR